MPNNLDLESTLTDRYQTTVPETVRRALRLNKRDKIHYSIRPGGEVLLTRAQPAETDDPVLSHFLNFLAHDLASHPERLQAIDANLMKRLKLLTSAIQVDLDAPLSCR